MPEVLAIVAAVCAATAAVCAILAWRKPAADLGPVLARFDALERAQERLERSVREQESAGRTELLQVLAIHERKLETQRTALEQRLSEARVESDAAFKGFRDSFVRTTGEMAEIGRAQSKGLDERLEALRATVEQRLEAIRAGNEQKLEAMRETVNEKLESTLNARLGESFSLVSERLEKVREGLGEMQQLALGVGDLKKVLSNVRTRGTWGEVQLGALLEQVLTPDQYAQNVAVTGTTERVEFAVRLPGRNPSESEVWLPIDSKFPQEDYARLLDASEGADKSAVDAARAELIATVQRCAKDVRRKYIEPPLTTDFAILFLPTESLYAEVLRFPGIVESLQRECRVTVAGPTTLGAFLNSLQMGFRTLAIEKRSSEVWQVLAAAKTEFQRYSELLGKVRKKLQEAGNHIDRADVRTRQINRKLRDVETVPDETVTALLGQSPWETDDELESEAERALTAGA